MKKTRYDNFRLEVDLPVPFLTDPATVKIETMRRVADDLIAQIKRHCDRDGGIGFRFDTTEYCSHCGYAWEEDAEGPLCCERAQIEWNTKKEKQ